MNVIWKVPYANCLKVNNDGAIRCCPSLTSCANIFKRSQSEYWVAFLRVQTFVYVVLMGVIYALKHA